MIEKIPEFSRKILKKHKIKNNFFEKFKNEIIVEYYTQKKQID